MERLNYYSSLSQQYPCTFYDTGYDDQGAIYTFGFNLFPTGLEIRITTRTDYGRYILYYCPNPNVIYVANGRFQSLDWISCTLHSYGHKIYSLHGVYNLTAYYPTITAGTWQHADSNGYDTDQTLIRSGTSTTYNNYPARKIAWKCNDNTFREFAHLNRIIFLESWLWIWQEIKYTSDLDLTHYPIVKRGSEYHLSSDISLQQGTTYTFLSYIGNCFLWGGSPTAGLENAFATNKLINDVFFEHYNRVINTNDPTITPHPSYFYEPPDRWLTGRLGVQGYDMSYITYQNLENNWYRFQQQSTLIKPSRIWDPIDNTKVPVTRDNPWVLFDNLDNNSTLQISENIDSEVRWLDYTHLKVKNQIYFIPYNWKVELHTRSVRSIGAPIPKYPPNFRYMWTYDTPYSYFMRGWGCLGWDRWARDYRDYHSNYVGMDFTGTCEDYTDPDNIITVDCSTLSWTNNWSFNTHSYLMERNNRMTDISGCFSIDSSPATKDIKLDVWLYTQDPYWPDNDCTCSSRARVEKLEISTNCPYINKHNKRTVLPNSTETMEHIDAASGNESLLSWDGNNTLADVSILSYANTLSTKATGYVKLKLKHKVNGSGLQPPSQIYHSFLSDIPSEYANVTRNYKGNYVSCEASVHWPAGDVDYESFGISFGVLYETNSNYAYTWQYLIAFPE